MSRQKAQMTSTNGTSTQTSEPQPGRFAESPGLHANDAPIAGDMLYGADAIATFLFGDRRHRRRVYNLVDQSRLPTFRIGANICARKSVLLEWIAAQERASRR